MPPQKLDSYLEMARDGSDGAGAKAAAQLRTTADMVAEVETFVRKVLAV